MPHWTPANRFVTAAASRCAVLWRYSASASGLSEVMILTDASRSSGKDRSTSLPSTDPASAAFSRRGEMLAARSATRVPAGTARLEPSGNVMLMSLMEIVMSFDSLRSEAGRSTCLLGRPSTRCARYLRLRGLPIHLRASYGGQAALACQP